jgi:hypothetical protein
VKSEELLGKEKAGALRVRWAAEQPPEREPSPLTRAAQPGPALPEQRAQPGPALLKRRMRRAEAARGLEALRQRA